jgi:hypothetical protein
VVVIGENTWGATGPITSTDVYNYGSFEIKEFMSVQMSSAMFMARDNNTYNIRGISLDIPIPFERSSLNMGIDKQLERAITEIH